MTSEQGARFSCCLGPLSDSIIHLLINEHQVCVCVRVCVCMCVWGGVYCIASLWAALKCADLLSCFCIRFFSVPLSLLLNVDSCP